VASVPVMNDLSGMVIMDEGHRCNSKNELAATCRLTADEIERLPSCSYPMLQSQFRTGSLFNEIGQGFQPRNECFLVDYDNDQGILNDEQQPAIKKIRRPRHGKTIDEKKEEIFISALPDDNGKCVSQREQSRPLSPNYACADPQFQAGSFGPHQFFWSQEFTLRADRISGVCPGRRRHAICKELDNTVCLISNRRMESFNLGDISHELEMLTGSRKRKRPVIEEY